MGRLRAIAAVLRTLVERGVDTTHPLYGVPLRKALEAVLKAAAALASQDAAACERALGAATLATLAAMAGDAAKVRAWVLA